MRALLLTEETEDHLSIEDLPVPQPENGQALVRIKAASLNHRDQWCREGKYPNIKYGTILGSDGAGVVEKVNGEYGKDLEGKDVVINPNINWGPNPAVQAKEYHILGMPTHGTFADYVTVPVDRLQEMPPHLGYAQAAALPLGGLTAFRAVFRHGQVQEGQRVLISGIGGGVAQFAFLFAKAAGALVYVTSGSPQKLEKAKAHGAEGGFNYKDENWQKEALKTSGGFDVIIDSAGGDQLNLLIRTLAPGGKIVFYGATTGMPSNLDLFRLFWNQGTLQGSTMGNDQEFAEMLQFISRHKIEPIIDSVRPFYEIISSFNDMRDFSQMGKLVVSME